MLVGVGEHTLRRWCKRFAEAVQDEWLASFTNWHALQPQTFALPQATEVGQECAIVALAASGLGLREKTLYQRELKPELLLSRLWYWGFQRLKRALFPSTCNDQGVDRGTGLNKGPPT